MADKPIGEQIADRAFEFYMRDIFKAATAHIERNDLEGARNVIRKAYKLGSQVHLEMLDAAARS